MTTINNYSVSLALNAGDYIRNSALSRKETNELKRSINAARTPAEKYDRAVGTLGKALKEGAISQQVYNRLLDDQKTKLAKAGKETGKLESLVTSVGAAWLGWQGASRVLANISQFLGAIRADMAAVDKLAKSARGIDATFNGLARLQFVAERIAGVSGPQLTEMVKKLTKQVGMANNGMTESVKTFEMLGLNIQELEQMRPEAQFNAVAAAIRKIPSPARQTAVAVKLFESEGKNLLPLLQATTAEVDQVAQKFTRFNLALGDASIKRIEATNDALADTAAVFRGFRQQLSELASSGELDAFNVKLADTLKITADLVKLWAGRGNSDSITGALDKWLLGFAGLDPDAGKPAGAGVASRSRPAVDVAALAKANRNFMAGPNYRQAGSILSSIAQGGLSSTARSGGMAASALSVGFSDIGKSIVNSVKLNTRSIVQSQEKVLVPAFEVGSAEGARAVMEANRNAAMAEAGTLERKQEKQVTLLEALTGEATKQSSQIERMLQIWEKSGPIKRIR